MSPTAREPLSKTRACFNGFLEFVHANPPSQNSVENSWVVIRSHITASPFLHQFPPFRQSHTYSPAPLPIPLLMINTYSSHFASIWGIGFFTFALYPTYIPELNPLTAIYPHTLANSACIQHLFRGRNGLAGSLIFIGVHFGAEEASMVKTICGFTFVCSRWHCCFVVI